MKRIRTVPGAAGAAGLLACLAAAAPCQASPAFQALPPTRDRAVARFEVPASKEPRLGLKRLVELLRRRVRYVFILYQENRSFDSYFGAFPGVDGLYSQAPGLTLGYYQPLKTTTGAVVQIEPFRIGPRQYASDLDDVNHSHPFLVKKMDVVQGRALMDHFALAEEEKHDHGQTPDLEDVQFGELTMAHEDGDTIPFLWRYADRFVICDHIFQLMTGPSTPGNLSIIAAQTGQTQAALHPQELFKGDGADGPGEPILNDSDPYWGSPEDTGPGPKMPVNPKDFAKPDKPVAYNQTYATLPLTLAGTQAKNQTDTDPDKKLDLDDLWDDVSYLYRKGGSPVAWGWYQEGFGKPIPSGADPTDADGVHFSYITHHNGPQYFGYIVHSPEMADSLHDLTQFYADVKHGGLSPEGGVYYVKGGYRNIFGLKPADPYPKVQKYFRGDDDHPADSDSQIAEAFLAHSVNAIAHSRYWRRCAIIITWDDSGGFYDHVPPPLRSFGPDGMALTDGPRLPFLLISPYARAHTVLHEQGDTGSVVKFVDTVFGLTPLANLPDELKGRALGEKLWHQANWGPDDALTQGVTDLVDAFDPARLDGAARPLPAAYAFIPWRLVDTLPQKSGYGCRAVGVEPVDRTRHLPNPIPAGFNPRPKTQPGD